MSPPSVGVGVEECQHNVTILASSGSIENVFQNIADIKERNYMGLSNCSSMDSSKVPIISNGNKSTLNIKATELRLGLPGSQSPERDPDHCLLSMSELNEKPLFPLHPSMDGNLSLSHKNIVSGNKRGFSDVMDGFSERKFLPKSDENARHYPNLAIKMSAAKESTRASVPASKMKEVPTAAIGNNLNQTNSPNNNNVAHATKAQVVGWPPIRSFRKNTLATSSKSSDEVDEKAGLGGLFVKVSMDGAPYLRKVDLKMYSAYQELSSSLEKMFSCFTIGQYGSHEASGRERLSETKLKDLLRGSEFVLTYEDKDGDWMLVGDVPWEMFIGTCKRLRIMKSADAIGLAPRAVEKC